MDGKTAGPSGKTRARPHKAAATIRWFSAEVLSEGVGHLLGVEDPQIAGQELHDVEASGGTQRQ